MKFKLGDYVTFKSDSHGGYGKLSGAMFKIVALELDEDRAIVMQTSKTRLNEEKRNFMNGNFYYSMPNISDMEEYWTFDDEDFETPITLEDWLDEDDDNCEEDYTEIVEYETLNLAFMVSQSVLTKVIKKGNSHLF